MLGDRSDAGSLQGRFVPTVTHDAMYQSQELAPDEISHRGSSLGDAMIRAMEPQASPLMARLKARLARPEPVVEPVVVPEPVPAPKKQKEPKKPRKTKVVSPTPEEIALKKQAKKEAHEAFLKRQEEARAEKKRLLQEKIDLANARNREKMLSDVDPVDHMRSMISVSIQNLKEFAAENPKGQIGTRKPAKCNEMIAQRADKAVDAAIEIGYAVARGDDRACRVFWRAYRVVRAAWMRSLSGTEWVGEFIKAMKENLNDC